MVTHVSVVFEGAAVKGLLLGGRLSFLDQFEAIFGARITFFIFNDVFGHVLLHVLFRFGERAGVVFLSFVRGGVFLSRLPNHLLD